MNERANLRTHARRHLSLARAHTHLKHARDANTHRAKRNADQDEGGGGEHAYNRRRHHHHHHRRKQMRLKATGHGHGSRGGGDLQYPVAACANPRLTWESLGTDPKEAYLDFAGAGGAPHAAGGGGGAAAAARLTAAAAAGGGGQCNHLASVRACLPVRGRACVCVWMCACARTASPPHTMV